MVVNLNSLQLTVYIVNKYKDLFFFFLEEALNLPVT